MQIGNVGTPIDYQELDVDGNPVDLTSATAITFHFESPSGVDKQFNGVVQDALNGVFRYTSALASDFDEEGPWKVQVAYTLGTFVGRTAVGLFTVFDNLS